MINAYKDFFYAEKIGLGKREHCIDKEIKKISKRMGESKKIDSIIALKISFLMRARERLKQLAEEKKDCVFFLARNNGRSGKLKITIDKKVVKELASYGMSKTLIAHSLGISPLTFNSRCEEDEELNACFNMGAAQGVLEVAKMLRESAQIGNVQAQIFYLKTQAGWKETTQVEHKGIKHENILLELESDYSEDDGV